MISNRQKKKNMIFAISVLFLISSITAFSACIDDDSSTPDIDPKKTESKMNVIDANNQFALDLYSKYRSQEGNIFFSPFSISTAFAMTYEGASGQTAEEMKQVLHLPDDNKKMRSDFVEIYTELNKEHKPYNLTTANALWAQKDYPFEEDYFRIIEKYYDGKATNLDFKSDTEKSRKTINDWVEDKTEGGIKDIIPLGILKPSTRLVLTNTIYFKANWSSQFDIEATREQDFKLDSGKNVKVDMMHMTESFKYGETRNHQILEMPYKGNDLSMLVILPKESHLSREGSLNELEDSFSVENLDDWKNDMNWELVQVSLPKFKFETKYFMKSDLEEMGMSTAFKYPEADFTKMSSTDELYIDKVIHQTFIDVNEAGTEAAAATVVMMGEMGMGISRPKTFTADHPFIFIIQKRDTGAILFMGRVSDPSE